MRKIWLLFPLLLLFAGVPAEAQWHRHPGFKKSFTSFYFGFQYGRTPYARLYHRGRPYRYRPYSYRAPYYGHCSRKHYKKHRKYRRGCHYCEHDLRYHYGYRGGRLRYFPHH